ncbi:MAG: radical SAM protein [Anaerolineales bacterium]|nr:radical SAM protein [Anaerolineales bacterium]
MTELYPAYRNLLDDGRLAKRVVEAYQHLSICDVCAWECPVDRRAGKEGVCRTGELARVSSYGPHYGEESPLSGTRGSGTIFFTRCNLRCQYCQNHDISQTDHGEEVEPEAISSMMLELQSQGCHNINFVSPSHVVPQILAAVLIAAQSGLRIPLVYNTGGFDSIAMLNLLDGVINIYMPDMKYSDPLIARRYSKIRNYPRINQQAVKEMHRQVGDLTVDQRGIALRGLLVRHLVLPNNLAGTREIIRYICEEVSQKTYLNIMDQYHPAYKSHHYPELDRRLSDQEYQTAVDAAIFAGMTNLDQK